MTPFAIRGFNPCESLLRHRPEQLRRFIRRMKTLNFNTIILHYDYGWKRYQDLLLEECKNAGVNIILMTFGPRTFFSYTPWKPQWFAKDLQGNPFTERLECETYPCCFEPEAIEAYGYGARCWLKSLPSAIKHVHMRAADGLMFCQCPKCRTLSQNEKWQPFVNEFVQAVLDTRPDLKFETDVYAKRYRIPKDHQAFHQMHNIMYDTFYRQPAYPIGSEVFPDPETTAEAADAILEPTPDALTPNAYHCKRLQEWTQKFPGKVYIHENAMMQGAFGVFQHATWTYLQELELFRKMGIQGVCFEAYEPGYSNFSEMFEILSKAMAGEEVAYEPTPLEIRLRNQAGSSVKHDYPAEEFISDPVKLKHTVFCREFSRVPSVENYRKLVEHVLEYEELFDPLFIGFQCAAIGRRKHCLDFKGLSEPAKDMIGRRKLWDFMEDIPDHATPYDVCRDLIVELMEKCVPAN